MCFVFVCDKEKMNYRIVFGFTFAIYVVCCLNSNYRNLMADNSIIVMINRIYPGTIYNGFLVGLFWIFLGYVFACKGTISDRKRSKIGLIISFVLLLSEYFIVKKYHLTVDNDCYFMLVPVCYFVFDSLISCEWKCKRIDVIVLRKYSTIIYCVHGSVAGFIGNYWIIETNLLSCILKFAIVLIISIGIAYAICTLERKKVFKCLHYAYWGVKDMRQNDGVNMLKGIACIIVVFLHISFPGILGKVIGFELNWRGRKLQSIWKSKQQVIH